MQGEFEIALGERRVDIVDFRLPSATIPDHHRSAAVLAFRNYALEPVVFDGVVFGLHGKAFVRRIEGRTFGNGPGKHDAVMLQAKIVMQSARAVLLDDEFQSFLMRAPRFAGRLGRHVEAALAVVLGEFAEEAQLGRRRTAFLNPLFHFVACTLSG